ncbi:eCIS core domain-containing protein [Streptomyces sp. NPDC001288]
MPLSGTSEDLRGTDAGTGEAAGPVPSVPLRHARAVAAGSPDVVAPSAGPGSPGTGAAAKPSAADFLPTPGVSSGSGEVSAGPEGVSPGSGEVSVRPEGGVPSGGVGVSAVSRSPGEGGVPAVGSGVDRGGAGRLPVVPGELRSGVSSVGGPGSPVGDGDGGVPGASAVRRPVGPVRPSVPPGRVSPGSGEVSAGPEGVSPGSGEVSVRPEGGVPSGGVGVSAVSRSPGEGGVPAVGSGVDRGGAGRLPVVPGELRSGVSSVGGPGSPVGDGDGGVPGASAVRRPVGPVRPSVPPGRVSPGSGEVSAGPEGVSPGSGEVSAGPEGVSPGSGEVSVRPEGGVPSGGVGVPAVGSGDAGRQSAVPGEARSGAIAASEPPVSARLPSQPVGTRRQPPAAAPGRRRRKEKPSGTPSTGPTAAHPGPVEPAVPSGQQGTGPVPEHPADAVTRSGPDDVPHPAAGPRERPAAAPDGTPHRPVAAQGGVTRGTVDAPRHAGAGEETTVAALAPHLAHRFMRDLGMPVSGVTVRRGPEAASRANRLGARAFTENGTVFLPDSTGPADGPEAEALLAHELVHAIQQSGHRTARMPSAAGEDPTQEAEAVTVERWVRGHPVRLRHPQRLHLPHASARPPEPVPDEVVQRAPLALAPSTDALAEAQQEPVSVTMPGSPPAMPAATVTTAAGTGGGPPPAQGAAGSGPGSSFESRLSELAAEVDGLRRRRFVQLDHPVQLDALADLLYERVSAHLRREMVVERERHGLLTYPA